MLCMPRPFHLLRAKETKSLSSPAAPVMTSELRAAATSDSVELTFTPSDGAFDEYIFTLLSSDVNTSVRFSEHLCGQISNLNNFLGRTRKQIMSMEQRKVGERCTLQLTLCQCPNEFLVQIFSFLRRCCG